MTQLLLDPMVKNNMGGRYAVLLHSNVCVLMSSGDKVKVIRQVWYIMVMMKSVESSAIYISRCETNASGTQTRRSFDF